MGHVPRTFQPSAREERSALTRSWTLIVLAAIAVLGGVYWLLSRTVWRSPAETPTAAEVEDDPASPLRPWPERTTEPLRQRLTKLRIAIGYLHAAAERERERNRPARELFLEARRLQGTDDARAEQLLRRAIELSPDYVPALSALADQELNTHPDEARELGLRCLALDDSDSVCHRTVIATYTRGGQFDEAFPHLAFCLEMDPRNIDCAGGMTSYYLSKGMLDAARTMVGWMRWVDPRSAFTLVAEGDLALKLGETAAARIAFQQACAQGQAHACTMLGEL